MFISLGIKGTSPLVSKSLIQILPALSIDDGVPERNYFRFFRVL